MSKHKSFTFANTILLTFALVFLLSFGSWFIPSANRNIITDAVIRAIIFTIIVYPAMHSNNLKWNDFLGNGTPANIEVNLAILLVFSLFLLSWVITETEVFMKIGGKAYLSASDSLFHLGKRAKFFITTLFVTPMGEEILFRGVILSLLLRNYDSRRANVGKALAFSMIHFRFNESPFSSILSTFFLGLLLGWFFIKTQNLIFIILIHSFWNMLVYLFPILMSLSGFSVIGVSSFILLIATLSILSFVGFWGAWSIQKVILRRASH